MAAHDCFISYTSADRAWAEWIAWQVEEAGYQVKIQALDFSPGANFVVEMQKATVECERTIAGSAGMETAEGPEAQTKIQSRLAREVEVLRRCIDWLQRLERDKTVVVNLRPDTEVETEFVRFDRPRVLRVLERIAADLDHLSQLSNEAHADKESSPRDARARHRHELAEPPRKPKKLSR